MLEYTPNDELSIIGIANSYYLLDEFDKALEIYLKLIETSTNDELFYNIANSYYMKG